MLIRVGYRLLSLQSMTVNRSCPELDVLELAGLLAQLNLRECGSLKTLCLLHD